MTTMLRHLPQVQSLLETVQGQALIAVYGHHQTVAALRARLQEIRAAYQSGFLKQLPAFDATFFARIEAEILRTLAPNLRKTINATGVIIHTNMGRAPLAPSALAAITHTAEGYSNLELDLGAGKRGSRYSHVEALLCELTGAEAALIVNNCAAGVVLCLSALASGQEVIVSRGELVEIGGSFRLPDVIAQSGAILREVGATNKTRIGDYAKALNDQTAILLKSHTSNYRIVGFTEAPTRAELATLAQDKGLLFLEDLGSGVLVDLSCFGLPDEPVVADVVKTGPDLVMFSGDKLLGGPQAGIIVGKSSVIAELKSHPLLRALRIDKLSLAALEATLRLYLPPNDPFENIPVLRMLSEPNEQLETRAKDLAAALRDAGVRVDEVIQTRAYAGGGSLPEQDLQSFAVVLARQNGPAHDLAAKLRRAEPPVLGRINSDQVHLDVRAVTEAELPKLVASVASALG